MGYTASSPYALNKEQLEKLEQDQAAKRAEVFKAICSKGLELPAPSTLQEQLCKSWGLVTTTPTMSGESSHALTPGVLDLPPMQTGLVGELQLGQPQPNTLPPWETWCPPLPGIIAAGWSVEVITQVKYIIQTPQGSKKWVLRFESHSEPRVAQ